MLLLEPIALPSGLVLKNRVALAPMTNMQSQADGLLGDDELAFLARRADGGFGMIETCAAYVALDGKAWHGELAVDRDACLPGLRRLAARIRQPGAAAIVQLFHGGVRADAALAGQPVWSATAFEEQGLPVPRAGTGGEIERTVEAFIEAAVRCRAAGFDGVELHGAHGYLIGQFLSRTQNTRTDAWGGADLVNRARMLRAIAQGVRARCGKQFTLGVRLSLESFGQAQGLDLDESLQVAKWLVEDGVDFLHASLWDFARNTTKRPDVHPLTALREVVPRPIAIVTAGKIWSRADAEQCLAKGADIVALGRSGIVNPDWPADLAAGREPQRSPVPRADLLARAVSPLFADYLSKWKNFIA